MNVLRNLQKKYEALEQKNAELSVQLNIAEKENQTLQNKVQKLWEQFKLAGQHRYGRKSEKHNANQLTLFDEIELTETELNAGSNEETDNITVTYERKRQPKRKSLPKDLPREIIEHDIDAADKICTCGCQLKRIGETTTEQLDVIPAQFKVIAHVRPKYACPSCEEKGVKIAPQPHLFLPKHMAAPGLVAHTAVAKFSDHLPLYRQAKIWKRSGIDFPRSTQCATLLKAAEQCKPLLQLIRQHIIASQYVQADETPVQVLKEPGRHNHQKSYMWCYQSDPDENPYVLFEYQPSRAGECARQFLDGMKGHVQCDGYAGYYWLDAEIHMTRGGCLAHARRKFMDVIKVSGEAKGLADEAVNKIKTLYLIEQQAREQQLSRQQRYLLRQEKSKPILDELKKWADLHVNKVPKTLKIGVAIRYLLAQWVPLYRYLDDGRYEIDNNATENRIRPFALGKKNWLFKGSPGGAKAGCCFYSLIANAEINHIDPYYYLRYVFENIANCSHDDDYRKLLPQQLDKRAFETYRLQCLENFQKNILIPE